MRRFEWWCINCETVVSLETRETKEDYERGVECVPGTPGCPMCDVDMFDVDDLTARDVSLLDPDKWRAFDRWRSKTKTRVL